MATEREKRRFFQNDGKDGELPESVKPANALPCVSYLRRVRLLCVEAVEDHHPGGEDAFRDSARR